MFPTTSVCFTTNTLVIDTSLSQVLIKQRHRQNTARFITFIWHKMFIPNQFQSHVFQSLFWQVHTVHEHILYVGLPADISLSILRPQRLHTEPDCGATIAASNALWSLVARIHFSKHVERWFAHRNYHVQTAEPLYQQQPSEIKYRDANVHCQIIAAPNGTYWETIH